MRPKRHTVKAMTQGDDEQPNDGVADVVEFEVGDPAEHSGAQAESVGEDRVSSIMPMMSATATDSAVMVML